MAEKEHGITKERIAELKEASKSMPSEKGEEFFRLFDEWWGLTLKRNTVKKQRAAVEKAAEIIGASYDEALELFKLARDNKWIAPSKKESKPPAKEEPAPSKEESRPSKEELAASKALEEELSEEGFGDIDPAEMGVLAAVMGKVGSLDSSPPPPPPKKEEGVDIRRMLLWPTPSLAASVAQIQGKGGSLEDALRKHGETVLEGGLDPYAPFADPRLEKLMGGQLSAIDRILAAQHEKGLDAPDWEAVYREAGGDRTKDIIKSMFKRLEMEVPSSTPVKATVVEAAAPGDARGPRDVPKGGKDDEDEDKKRGQGLWSLVYNPRKRKEQNEPFDAGAWKEWRESLYGGSIRSPTDAEKDLAQFVLWNIFSDDAEEGESGFKYDKNVLPKAIEKVLDRAASNPRRAYELLKEASGEEMAKNILNWAGITSGQDDGTVGRWPGEEFAFAGSGDNPRYILEVGSPGIRHSKGATTLPNDMTVRLRDRLTGDLVSLPESLLGEGKEGVELKLHGEPGKILRTIWDGVVPALKGIVGSDQVGLEVDLDRTSSAMERARREYDDALVAGRDLFGGWASSLDDAIKSARKELFEQKVNDPSIEERLGMLESMAKTARSLQAPLAEKRRELEEARLDRSTPASKEALGREYLKQLAFLQREEALKGLDEEEVALATKLHQADKPPYKHNVARVADGRIIKGAGAIKPIRELVRELSLNPSDQALRDYLYTTRLLDAAYGLPSTGRKEEPGFNEYVYLPHQERQDKIVSEYADALAKANALSAEDAIKAFEDARRGAAKDSSVTRALHLAYGSAKPVPDKERLASIQKDIGDLERRAGQGKELASELRDSLRPYFESPAYMLLNKLSAIRDMLGKRSEEYRDRSGEEEAFDSPESISRMVKAYSKGDTLPLEKFTRLSIRQLFDALGAEGFKYDDLEKALGGKSAEARKEAERIYRKHLKGLGFDMDSEQGGELLVKVLRGMQLANADKLIRMTDREHADDYLSDRVRQGILDKAFGDVFGPIVGSQFLGGPYAESMGRDWVSAFLNIGDPYLDLNSPEYREAARMASYQDPVTGEWHLNQEKLEDVLADKRDALRKDIIEADVGGEKAKIYGSDAILTSPSILNRMAELWRDQRFWKAPRPNALTRKGARSEMRGNAQFRNELEGGKDAPRHKLLNDWYLQLSEEARDRLDKRANELDAIESGGEFQPEDIAPGGELYERFLKSEDSFQEFINRVELSWEDGDEKYMHELESPKGKLYRNFLHPVARLLQGAGNFSDLRELAALYPDYFEVKDARKYDKNSSEWRPERVPQVFPTSAARAKLKKLNESDVLAGIARRIAYFSLLRGETRPAYDVSEQKLIQVEDVGGNVHSRLVQSDKPSILGDSLYADVARATLSAVFGPPKRRTPEDAKAMIARGEVPEVKGFFPASFSGKKKGQKNVSLAERLKGMVDSSKAARDTAKFKPRVVKGGGADDVTEALLSGDPVTLEGVSDWLEGYKIVEGQGHTIAGQYKELYPFMNALQNVLEVLGEAGVSSVKVDMNAKGSVQGRSTSEIVGDIVDGRPISRGDLKLLGSLAERIVKQNAKRKVDSLPRSSRLPDDQVGLEYSNVRGQRAYDQALEEARRLEEATRLDDGVSVGEYAELLANDGPGESAEDRRRKAIEEFNKAHTFRG